VKLSIIVDVIKHGVACGGGDWMRMRIPDLITAGRAAASPAAAAAAV